jgi:hypothetical protein
LKIPCRAEIRVHSARPLARQDSEIAFSPRCDMVATSRRDE